LESESQSVCVKVTVIGDGNTESGTDLKFKLISQITDSLWLSQFQI